MQTPYQFRTYFMMSSSQPLIPRFSFFSIVLFTACSLFSSLARASIVSLTGLYATAYEGNGGGETIYSPALGTTVLDTAGTIYDSTASTSRQLLSLTASSTGGLFQSNVEQYRAADLYNQAAGSEIRSLNFEVNQNTAYSLSGFYSVTQAGLAGQHSFNVDLYDSVSGAIFQHASISRVTNDETFSLGVASGDYDNSIYGSATGVLQTGRSYQLHFYTSLWDQYTVSTEASAIGCFAMELGDQIGQSTCGASPVTPVPAPLTLFTFFTGLVGLSVRRALVERVR